MRKLEPIVEAENQIYRRGSWGFAVKCRNEVEEAPTIEPSAQPERANGKWINDGDPATWVCSNCGYRVRGYNNTKFCPNCGCEMER